MQEVASSTEVGAAGVDLVMKPPILVSSLFRTSIFNSSLELQALQLCLQHLDDMVFKGVDLLREDVGRQRWRRLSERMLQSAPAQCEVVSKHLDLNDELGAAIASQYGPGSPGPSPKGPAIEESLMSR